MDSLVQNTIFVVIYIYNFLILKFAFLSSSNRNSKTPSMRLLIPHSKIIHLKFSSSVNIFAKSSYFFPHHFLFLRISSLFQGARNRPPPIFQILLIFSLPWAKYFIVVLLSGILSQINEQFTFGYFSFFNNKIKYQNKFAPLIWPPFLLFTFNFLPKGSLFDNTIVIR